MGAISALDGSAGVRGSGFGKASLLDLVGGWLEGLFIRDICDLFLDLLEPFFIVLGIVVCRLELCLEQAFLEVLFHL